MKDLSVYVTSGQYVKEMYNVIMHKEIHKVTIFLFFVLKLSFSYDVFGHLRSPTLITATFMDRNP